MHVHGHVYTRRHTHTHTLSSSAEANCASELNECVCAARSDVFESHY